MSTLNPLLQFCQITTLQQNLPYGDKNKVAGVTTIKDVPKTGVKFSNKRCSATNLCIGRPNAEDGLGKNGTCLRVVDLAKNGYGAVQIQTVNTVLGTSLPEMLESLKNVYAKAYAQANTMLEHIKQQANQ